MRMSRSLKLGGLLAMLVASLSFVTLDQAEARMGGSFGSRGARTFQSAPPTTTAPFSAGPVQRSMTPNKPSYAPPPPLGQTRPSFWSGFGGGLVGGMLGGLLFGGVFGMLSGHGFGGLGGGLGFVFQLLLIGGLIFLALRFFRGRGSSPPQAAGGAGPFSFGQQNYGAATPPSTPPAYGTSPANGGTNSDEIGVTQADFATFERTLRDVQDAYTREDHQGLRRLTTPEMVSYLSEELADNATHGVKNEVTNLRFLNGDLAEAWREENRDFATMAMRWSANDLMRNRQTGAVEKGDPDKPVETTELWTFTRETAGPWLLSAIQDARRAA